MKKQTFFIHISKSTFALFLLLGLIISLSNCEKNSVAPAPITLPAIASYNNDIQPLFDLYCNMSGCHSGSDPAHRLDLTRGNSYNSLFQTREIDTLNPSNSRLYTALSSPMPPWGKLIPYDMDLILEWIQQGAKNN